MLANVLFNITGLFTLKIMKPLFIKVYLFDPKTKEEFPVFDDVGVEVVKIKSKDPPVYINPLELTPDSQRKIFYIHAPSYKLTRRHQVCVGFSNPNFSKTLRRFVSSNEIGQGSPPICYLSNFPDLEWDAGDRYRAKEYFPFGCLRDDMTMDQPSVLKVPVHQLYNIGHRGAPYHFPENTIASFQKALELGANGLEFDLCFTKDKKIVILHDPKPNPDRAIVEELPYELVPLEFITQNGQMIPVDEYNIMNLTLDQVREIYYYRRVEGLQKVQYQIPDLDEFLRFIHQEGDRLGLLYFDVKNPDWDEKRDETRFIEYGSVIGNILKQYASLPIKLIICNSRPKVLKLLKLGIEKASEKRCNFGYDAEGNLAALLGGLERKCRQWPEPLRSIVRAFLALLKSILGRSYHPLKIARRMKNTVVAIGSLFRPGSLEEIEEAIHDRDHDASSPVETVIHWTLNDPGKMCQSLSAGVNGIVTDKPDELKRLLERLGIAVT
jgi:glycerophosphoryl diester phosphodiesterase